MRVRNDNSTNGSHEGIHTPFRLKDFQQGLGYRPATIFIRMILDLLNSDKNVQVSPDDEYRDADRKRRHDTTGDD